MLSYVDTGIKLWNIELKIIHTNAHGKNISPRFLSEGLIISLHLLVQLHLVWVLGTIGMLAAFFVHLQIRQ